MWTNIIIVSHNVIFTTITYNMTNLAATPTGVGREKVQKAGECCIFYNIWHDSLDFTTAFIYNKA